MGSLPLLLKFDDFCLLGVMVYWLLLWFFLSITKGLHARFGCFAGC